MPWLPAAARRGVCPRRRGGRPGQDQTARAAARRAGVDLILAQGTEAGGHTGEVATMVLVPEVADLDGPARSGACPGLTATSLQLVRDSGLRYLP